MSENSALQAVIVNNAAIKATPIKTVLILRITGLLFLFEQIYYQYKPYAYAHCKHILAYPLKHPSDRNFGLNYILRHTFSEHNKMLCAKFYIHFFKYI